MKLCLVFTGDDTVVDQRGIHVFTPSGKESAYIFRETRLRIGGWSGSDGGLRWRSQALRIAAVTVIETDDICGAVKCQHGTGIAPQKAFSLSRGAMISELGGRESRLRDEVWSIEEQEGADRKLEEKSAGADS